MAAVNGTNGMPANGNGASFTPDAGFDPKANKIINVGAPRSLAQGVCERGRDSPTHRRRHRRDRRPRLPPCGAVVTSDRKDSSTAASSSKSLLGCWDDAGSWPRTALQRILKCSAGPASHARTRPIHAEAGFQRQPRSGGVGCLIGPHPCTLRVNSTGCARFSWLCSADLGTSSDPHASFVDLQFHLRLSMTNDHGQLCLLLPGSGRHSW